MLQELKEQFDTDGYVVIDNAFPQLDLLCFRKTFQETVKHVLNSTAKKHPNLREVEVSGGCDKALLALRYVDPEYVSVIQRIISRTPEFFKLSSSQNVFNTVRHLLDLPELSPLYILSNGIVFTNPYDKSNKRSSNFELDWHKDTFFTIPKSRFIQFWGPVIHDSTEEIGTLLICPGSHKHGYGKQRININTEFNHRFSTAPDEITRYSPKPINLSLGQLLIFDGQLIHASGENTSNLVRTTMIGLCHDASREECVPVSTRYLYHGKTPEAWFYEVYGDEKAKEIMYEQLAPTGEPPGGV